MTRGAPGTLVVRPARAADYPEIARLTVAAYRADGQLTIDSGYDRVLADVPGRAAAGELLVAVDGTGAILGSVVFVLPGTPYAELSRPGEAEFRTLAVDPAAQGRGVGAALARACLRRAAELGCHGVVICTRDNALAAQRLYARLGFRRLPERDWTPFPGIRLLALYLDLPPAGPHPTRAGAGADAGAGAGAGEPSSIKDPRADQGEKHVDR